jgi:hypothetical protein
MEQTSAASIGLLVQLKGSGVVFETSEKISAGLIVWFVEKSVPGIRSTILDIGSESTRLIRHSLSGGTQGMEDKNQGTVVDLDGFMLSPVLTLQRGSINAIIPPYAVARVRRAWQDV